MHPQKLRHVDSRSPIPLGWDRLSQLVYRKTTVMPKLPGNGSDPASGSRNNAKKRHESLDPDRSAGLAGSLAAIAQPAHSVPFRRLMRG